MKDVLAAGAVYAVGAAAAPMLVERTSSLGFAVLLLAAVSLALAALAGLAARGLAGRGGAKPARAAAGVCAATLLGVLAALWLLAGQNTSASQRALVVPSLLGLLFLGPSAGLADIVARRKPAAGR